MNEHQIQLIEKLPDILHPTPTLLEIGGYPHYENVVSNYLAFYFDPTREHGLKDLLLKAWCDTIGISEKQNFSSVKVSREVTTKENKRIDLLVVTPQQVFCIENKIFHNAEGNPLSKYETYVKSQFPNHQYHFAILSLDEVSKKITKGNEFKNILYQDFIKVVESELLKQKDAQCYHLHYFFLKDLLQSIKNLRQKQDMQKETLRLIQNNLADFQKLSHHLTDLQKDMDNRIQIVKKGLDKKEFPIRDSQIWLSGKEDARKELKTVLIYTLEIEKENPKTELKIRLTPKGWTIELWNYHHNRPINGLFQKQVVNPNGSKQDYYQVQNEADDYFSPSTYVEECVERLLKLAGITNT